MAQSHLNKIPRFYRVAFIYIDPLIAGSGAYMDFFTPAKVIDAIIPASIAPYNPSFAFLQHQLAAALLMCIILDLFLLRKTHELWVWDPVQAGQFMWDIIMAVSQLHSISQQGRLNVWGMRPEDWGGLAIVIGIGLVRLAFLARVGMKVDGRKGKSA